MIITYHGLDNFVIKTKSKIVKIGQSIELGELKIETPGEYESGGVQVEVIDGMVQVFSERMSVLWFKKGKLLNDQEAEKVNGSNILLIGVGGGEFTETKTAIDLINQIEPSLVVPMYKENLDEFVKEEGVTGEGLDQLKIQLADLPQEERKIVTLNPQK